MLGGCSVWGSKIKSRCSIKLVAMNLCWGVGVLQGDIKRLMSQEGLNNGECNDQQICKWRKGFFS